MRLLALIRRLFPGFRPLSRWWVASLVTSLAMLGGARMGSCAEAFTNTEPFALWDASARVQVGGGYRANVLLAHVLPQGSSFISVGGDASLIRLSETGSELTMFIVGEDAQYLSSVPVNGERFYSVSAQLLQPLGARDKAGGEVAYLYQYQVLDVSETEDLLRRVLVEGHNISLRPQWRHTLSAALSLQLDLGGQRQLYMGELDDFWEASASLSLAYNYGRNSEFAVGFRSVNWIYDTREQATANGVPIPDTSLYYWRPEFFGQWRHYFDQEKHWRTTTRLAWLWNLDNGSGYYDYNRLTLVQKLRWSQTPWEISAGARFGWYFYQLQEFVGELRQRSYIVIDLRVERRLGKRLYAYATGERDWNYGTEPLDDYRDWIATAGLGVDF